MKGKWRATIILALLLTGCTGTSLIGSGRVAEQRFDLTGFDSVDVCCGMELFLETGLPESIRIVADDNILAAMDVRRRGNTLIADFGSSLGILDIIVTRPIQVFVSLPELSRVEVSGGGLVSASNLSAPSLLFNLSGGSDAYLENVSVAELAIDSSGGGTISAGNVQVDQFDLILSGGGEITLTGQATTFTAELSGGSELFAERFFVTDTDLEIGGGGRSSLSVSNSMSVTLSGGSRLDYYGSPQIDRQRVSSASELVEHSTP